MKLIGPKKEEAMQMPRILAITAIAVFLIFNVNIDLAAQEPASRMILVLDASGSMWGQIEGRHKIQIARDVVAELLADWDADVHLGLTAYGHRVKGDCSDIEHLIATGPVDGSAFQTTVNGINPKGKTPLSQAVIEAVQELRYSEEKATVILISDGEETCNMDPCEVGRQLEEAGVDFTAHIVGFDVEDASTLDQLRCLAENTGGTFRTASDAGDLSGALEEVVEETIAADTSVDSAFDDDAEGWTIVGDGNLDKSVNPELDDGALKAIDEAAGGVWYWQAPSTFLGDRSRARELRYRLRTTANTKPFDAADVILKGAGHELVFDTVELPDEEWTQYRVPLRADAGWIHRESQEAATDDELQAVLAALEQLLIRGEYQTGNDTGWLDDVTLGAAGR